MPLNHTVSRYHRHRLDVLDNAGVDGVLELRVAAELVRAAAGALALQRRAGAGGAGESAVGAGPFADGLELLLLDGAAGLLHRWRGHEDHFAVGLLGHLLHGFEVSEGGRVSFEIVLCERGDKGVSRT